MNRRWFIFSTFYLNGSERCFLLRSRIILHSFFFLFIKKHQRMDYKIKCQFIRKFNRIANILIIVTQKRMNLIKYCWFIFYRNSIMYSFPVAQIFRNFLNYHLFVISKDLEKVFMSDMSTFKFIGLLEDIYEIVVEEIFKSFPMFWHVKIIT